MIKQPESLSLESDIVRAVQYELQIQLNAPRLLVHECVDVSTASQAKQFSEFCNKLETKNIAHVFIPISELEQPLSDVYKRGVRINPKKGNKICVGHVNVESGMESLELAHCLVALGVPQNWQKFEVDYDNQEFEPVLPVSDDLMEGYHSIKISKDGEYIIYNPSQIRTLHIVRSNVDIEQRRQTDNHCSLCHTSLASVYCVNCAALLCRKCSNESHSVNPLLKSHQILPVEISGAYFEFCPYHPNHRVEHYCPQCKMPVCLECKLSGHHSTGLKANHKLLLLNEAYLSILTESEKENEICSRRKRKLETKIRDADNRYEDIKQNAKTIETRILKMAEEAIKSLRHQVGEKLLSVKSVRDELERKMCELDKHIEMVQLHKDLSNPIAFLQAYDVNNDIVTHEMKNNDDLPLDLWVQGDLALVGSLDVKPRQLVDRPQGLKKRDLDFEERNVRVTEDDSTATQTKSEISPEYNLSLPHPQKNEENHKTRKSVKLSSMASRKRSKLLESGIEIKFQPFEGSNIMTDSTMATMLYLCFPFKSAPQPHLLFSVHRDGRSIRRMHEAIDDVGITCIIIQRGEFIFGGFAAVKWNSNGKPFGQGSSSFLFSVTHDSFIPYRPKVDDPCCLMATKDTLTFGKLDLNLSNSFDQCTSELENSYSVGLAHGSEEASTFLAGSNVFAADEVEVWGFFN